MAYSHFILRGEGHQDVCGLLAWIANRADGAWIVVFLNLPQSPANLYRTHFKMPGSGLPKILELTINSILEKRKLASYKIAGNGLRTTIVLQFDANILDTNVSPVHVHHKPEETRKGNIRRTMRIVQQKFCSNACRETKMNPQICGDDSALHSQSVFYIATCTGLETKQIEIQRENNPNNLLPLRANCSNHQHYRDEQQPLIRQQGKEPLRKRRQE